MTAEPKAHAGPEPRYPNMEAAKAAEREQHVRQAMAGGLTRKQAEKHVRDDHERDT